MAQDRLGEFGEEALNEIEPRTMLGREGKLEASRRSSVEPGSCFSRYVRRMIIEDQLDRGTGRISGVETLEEFDELPAAVAVSDERMDLPGKQVDSGQQAQRAMTFVLIIPRKGGVDAGGRAPLRRSPARYAQRGLGGKSGAVVAMAWIPGFSS